MKQITKILVAFLVAFSFSGVGASANDKGSLKVAIYSKEGGNAWMQGQMLHESMLEAGYKSEVLATDL